MQDHSTHGESAFSVSRVLTTLALGGAAVAAGVIAAPHVLPALGIGSAEMAEESMFVLHTSAEAGGSGIAGAVNNLLSTVPWVGDKLAQGGLFTAGASAGAGVGGVLIGDYLHKRSGGEGFSWGRFIKYAGMTASALIALPTLLTALGTGIIYLSTLGGPENIETANQVVQFVDKTLGTAGTHSAEVMGLSGAASALPHLLTCGMPLLPAAFSLHTLHDKDGGPFVARVQLSPNVPGRESIVAEVALSAPTAAGAPCEGRLRLVDTRTGRPVEAADLAVTHTEKLHLLVVDQSLQDYRHIHPQPTGAPGEFAFSFTPRTGNRYGAWAEFTTAEDRQPHRVRMALPAASGREVRPAVRVNDEAQGAGLQFTWEADTPLRQGRASTVTVHVTGKDGKPVRDLEPVMGSYAHLVGFSADGRSIIHAHPKGAEPLSTSERGGPALRFHVQPESAGPVQFYLQAQRNGQDVYASFGQAVRPAERATERLAFARHHDAPGQQPGV